MPGRCPRRDFYFEATQIRMQPWASGRIALVGDAAYCCSPIGGQGSSVALIGAYTLAGELKLARYDGRVDYRQGCHAYETHVRRYVLAFQAFGVRLRDERLDDHARPVQRNRLFDYARFQRPRTDKPDRNSGLVIGPRPARRLSKTDGRGQRASQSPPADPVRAQDQPPTATRQ